MKILLSLAFVAALLASAFSAGVAPRTASAQDPAVQQALEARVAALETALTQEKARHQETRALLEQTVGYLERQAKGAEAVLAVLDASEEAGFTSGINFESRVILLGGLREFWTGVRTAVPQSKPPPPAPKEPPGKEKTPAATEKPPAR